MTSWTNLSLRHVCYYVCAELQFYGPLSFGLTGFLIPWQFSTHWQSVSQTEVYLSTFESLFIIFVYHCNYFSENRSWMQECSSISYDNISIPIKMKQTCLYVKSYFIQQISGTEIIHLPFYSFIKYFFSINPSLVHLHIRLLPLSSVHRHIFTTSHSFKNPSTAFPHTRQRNSLLLQFRLHFHWCEI